MQLVLERIEQRVGAAGPPVPARPDAGAARGDRAAGRHAGRQDHADARDGRARRAHEGPGHGRRPRRDRQAGARAQRRDGVPAVHQLPVDDGGRQHRFAAAGCAARTAKRDIDARVDELAAKLHIEPFLRAPARRAVGRPAAARGAGARAGQERAADAARRAAREPRLQAARGAARGALAVVRQRSNPPWSTPPPSRPRRCCSAATPRCWTPASCCSTGRRPRSSTGPDRSASRAPSAIRR